MPGKIRVGILFGGRSAEHEVSLQSARNIIDAIDRNKYEIVLIGIDKKGNGISMKNLDFSFRQLNRNCPSCPKAERT